jgi:hypothetical protein
VSVSCNAAYRCQHRSVFPPYLQSPEPLSLLPSCVRDVPPTWVHWGGTRGARLGGAAVHPLGVCLVVGAPLLVGPRLCCHTGTGGATTGVQSPVPEATQVLGTRESGSAPSGSQAKSSGAVNPQQAARQPDEASDVERSSKRLGK